MTKISGLPVSGTLDGTYLFPVVDIGTPDVTQQATLSQLGVIYLPLTGGTLSGGLELTSGTLSVDSGTVTIGTSAALSTSYVLNSSTGANSITYETAGVVSWKAATTSSTWLLARYTAGVLTDAPINILASDGSVTLSQGLTVNSGTIGVAGAQPYVVILSSTLNKGETKISTSANTGNTITTLNVASQANTRTYTIPDAGSDATFMMTGATMASDGMIESSVPLMSLRNSDGTTLDATGSSTTFKVSSSVATSLSIAGANAKSTTITSDAIVEYVMPATYIAGKAFNVVVNALIAGTGTPGTKTLAVKAYAIGTDGAQGSNLGPATQNMTTSAVDYTFAISGSGVTPGKRILINPEAVLQETGGSNNINTQINSVRVK